MSTCVDCRRRAGSRRGFAGMRICDPCWSMRVKHGPPRNLGTFETIDDGLAEVVGHVIHEETITIRHEREPARCPACVDGLQSNGLDRCATCGGTAERDRHFGPERPTLAEFARDVLGIEPLPAHAEALLDVYERARAARVVVHTPARHGRAFALSIVRAYLEAHAENLDGSEADATSDE